MQRKSIRFTVIVLLLTAAGTLLLLLLTQKKTECTTDFNGDGVTDTLDLSELKKYYGMETDKVENRSIDLNHDGIIDSGDLGILLSSLNQPCK